MQFIATMLWAKPMRLLILANNCFVQSYDGTSLTAIRRSAKVWGTFVSALFVHCLTHELHQDLSQSLYHTKVCTEIFIESLCLKSSGSVFQNDNGFLVLCVALIHQIISFIIVDYFKFH